MATNPFNYNLPTSNKTGSKITFNFQPSVRTPYDIVKIEDFTFPGISRLEIQRAKKAKVQTKKQGKGDKLIDSGLELATIKITTKIFFDEDYNEIERIIDYFENRVGLGNGTTANSFSINHPDTRMRKIFNIFVESIDGPYHYMPASYTEFIFNCREVVKPKPQTPKAQKEASQKVIETTTPINPDLSKNLPPSQDSSVTQPNRKGPLKT